MSEDVSLREHLETLVAELDKRHQQRFAAQQVALKDALLSQEKAVSAALAAAKEAVVKAEIASEKRFDAVNEFRQTLSDQTATFIPRAEAMIKFDGLDKAIDELKTSRDTSVGKIEGSDKSWGVIITIITVGLAILAFMGFK